MIKSSTLPIHAAGVARAAPAATGGRWIERLAAWADRQPQHHRLGQWTSPTVMADRQPFATPR
jgi:hypothetical protein